MSDEPQRIEILGGPLEDPGDANADVEVLALCHEALQAAGEGAVTLSLGHVGGIRAAMAELELGGDEAPADETLLPRKDAAGFLAALPDPPPR